MSALELAKKLQLIQEPPVKRSRKVPREELINRLNHRNFLGDDIVLSFRHSKLPHVIKEKAIPHPCMNEHARLSWRDPEDMPQKFEHYHFEHFYVDDGLKLLRVDAELTSLDNTGADLILPEEASEVSFRLHRRHACKGIKAQFFLHGAQFEGMVENFSPDYCQIKLSLRPPQTHFWIDIDAKGYLVFTSGDQVIYSGPGSLVRRDDGTSPTYLFRLLSDQAPRFQEKEFRSSRHRLVPTPRIKFVHPLTRKLMTLSVFDISGTGFSVEEDIPESVFLPGLMLPNVEIAITRSLALHCQAQVINREKKEDEKGQRYRLGIAILDMSIQDHATLESIVQQASDRNSICSDTVDMDDLWNFFFETGFIYPKKYMALEEKKEELKRTYQKLYQETPDVAKHFTYQDNGRILGHMSTLRFYDNCWLIHHHAASKLESNRAGLVVLNQIGRFVNDSRNLYSIHLRYAICYYRPDNKFPDRVFGGVFRHTKDPSRCSMDRFAYLHVSQNHRPDEDEADNFVLTPATSQDLQLFASFYRQESDGLLVRAMDFLPESAASEEVIEDFRKAGFKREKYLFGLKKNGRLHALLLLNLSDLGLNMSDLTNCLHVFVVDPEGLTKNVLLCKIADLLKTYRQETVPLLMYPTAYAEKEGFEIEKYYNLWILNMHHMDDYFRFLKRLLRRITL